MDERKLKFLLSAGYKSRKLIMTLIAFLLLSLFALLTVRFPALNTNFSTFTSGILGALGLYLGGNVASKVVGAKGFKRANFPIEEEEHDDEEGKEA